MNAGFDRDDKGEALLLTSLDSFWSIIEPLMTSLDPRRICEIGIGNGDFSRRLIGYCRESCARYIGVDPTTSDEFVDELQSGISEFVRKASLDALTELEPCELYFIDGDHNYYTVRSELNSIRNAAPDVSMIVLHDVAWPWARRDQYCDPESIPEEHRHDYSREKKVAPGEKRLAERGFSGEESDYNYAVALEEGGAANGVLTAVDDFVAEHAGDNWSLLLVPAVFGLGVLCRKDILSDDLRGRIGDMDIGLHRFADLLALMESNRIDLFLAFTDNLRHIRELKDQYQALHEHERGLAKHAADLLEAYKDLRKYADRLGEQVRELRNIDGD